MSNNERRGLKSKATDTGKAAPNGARDHSTDDVDEKATRGCAGDGGRSPSPSEYEFSWPNNAHKGSVEPTQVEVVFAALLQHLGGSTGYVKANQLDVADLTNHQISRAINLLGQDDNCPITTETWTDSGTHTETWYVEFDTVEATGSADADQWIGETCPECGVEIDGGSLRYNGYAWEHKNPEAHPQAAHHIITETIPGGEPITDGGTDVDEDLAGPGGPLTRLQEARKQAAIASEQLREHGHEYWELAQESADLAEAAVVDIERGRDHDDPEPGPYLSPAEIVGADGLQEVVDGDRELKTDGGVVNACPACDSTAVSSRVRSDGHYCEECGADFDEPVQRTKNHEGYIGQGIARQLSEMDVDEFDDAEFEVTTDATSSEGGESDAV